MTAAKNARDARSDVDAFADRDREPVHGLKIIDTTGSAPSVDEPLRVWHQAPRLVEAIVRHSREPWVSLSISGAEIYRLRSGSVAMVTGAPGAGKSTLVTAMMVEHARNHGPALYISVELDREELAARIVGMHCDASWEDSLRGLVPRSDMERVLDLPRLAVIDGEHATLEHLSSSIDQIRATWTDEPILVAVDYLQIIDSKEKELRARVASVAQQLRRLAKAYRVVVVGISQPSRAAGRALGAGELVGADTMTAMAESAEIERAAYVTLAIGAHAPERADGTRVVDLSIGKGRMGGGDRVVPMSYNGRSGRWLVDGESRPASEVRAEREAGKDAAKLESAELAIMGAIGRTKEPQTRDDLRSAAHLKQATTKDAIDNLLKRGELVEVRRKAPRSAAWKLWTRERATAEGIQIVEQVAVES